MFPDGDLPEESQDENGQTPSEGINTPVSENGENGDNGQIQPEETTKAYETDEYVDTDGGSGIPDAVPANEDEAGETDTQVTFPNAGEATLPAQTDSSEESSEGENSENTGAGGEGQESTEDESSSETQASGV